MKKLLLIYILFSISVVVWSNNEDLYLQLDDAIENNDRYVQMRERRISDLRKLAKYHSNDIVALMGIEDDVFYQYYAYRYDSAMAAVKRGYQLALESKNPYYQYKNLIHRTLLLSSAGFYSDAEACMDSIPSEKIPKSLLFDYYYNKYQLYSFWDNYYIESEFRSKLKGKIAGNLQAAIKYATPNTPIYYFTLAALSETTGSISKAESYYKKVLSFSNSNNPLYGSAAYNLATILIHRGDSSNYERYLLIAAISDIKNAVKENTALQDLAMYIFHSKGDMEKAEKYITFSNKDAQFYNSRLRMFSLSQRLPVIMAAYQSQLTAKNNKLFWVSVMALILVGISIIFLIGYYRQNLKLRKSKRIISKSNTELVEQYKNVYQLNKKLLDVNLKRERLAKVYIDIYAKLVERSKNFRTLVKRKIKANQTKDLLARLSEMELSKEEGQEFLNNFDKAFLDMYPGFVDEVNMLLRDDCKITDVPAGGLNTELRVLALIHLGVTESAEIANLLFYSPQTIYNYRWGARAKAKVKETFEQDIMNLRLI